MQHRSPPWVVALLAATALAASACSNSTASGAASGSRNGKPGASAPGVTATQYILGSTQPLTGAAAPGYGEIAPASNAVFKWVNAHGGIHGRTIVYNYLDDAYNPAQTVIKTRQLTAQPVFADFDPLGTPTQLQVQGFLNRSGVPQLFVASGCSCWSNPSYPLSFGWQTNYIIEGKILGHYIKQHFAGRKVAYIYQDDEFGQDGVAGLKTQIPSSGVATQQPYSVTQFLATGITSQVAAAQAAHAGVVVLYAIPAVVAATLLTAAKLGYHPAFVVSSVGIDPHTLEFFFKYLTSKAKAKNPGAALLNGVTGADFLPSPNNLSNPWVALFHQIWANYDSGQPFDNNTIYGMGAAITMVDLLKAAGPNPTRQSLVAALDAKGASFATPGLGPLTYSKSNHYGYEESQLGMINGNGVFTLSGPVYTTTNSPSVPVSTLPASTAAAPGFTSPNF
ncbi:MAG TPA: ABC transporter substrate-binding protein [Streptosporangiaceae bacterium]|nr:ABC transporter substrate-binding protein [Streptosporangiaceae bacterium]